MTLEHWLRPVRRALYQQGDGDLAAALGDQDAYRRLSDRRKAQLDAFLVGTGYLVDGKRVDPSKVVVVVNDRPSV